MALRNTSEYEERHVTALEVYTSPACLAMLQPLFMYIGTCTLGSLGANFVPLVTILLL